MGQALIKGWLAQGLDTSAVYIHDPNPSDWAATHLNADQINAPLPDDLEVLFVAVKPQLIDAVLPDIDQFGGGRTIIISIAAGIPIARFECALGVSTPVVRVMPNLPVPVGQGASAMVGNAAANPHLPIVSTLMQSVGDIVQLPEEHLLHAVTGVSGSGPAYVFAMTEALAAAGEQAGLPSDLARKLARQTVAGAGAMLTDPNSDPSALRQAVTSKGGTTAAGLDVLSANNALNDLIAKTVNAAQKRSEDLAGVPDSKG